MAKLSIKSHWRIRPAARVCHFLAIAGFSLTLSQQTFGQHIQAKDDPTAIAARIGLELANGDPDIQRKGLQEVTSFALDGSLGGGETTDRAWRCWAYLDVKWLDPLLALKQYDLVQRIAASGMTFHKREDDASRIDAMQYCIVRALLASGQFDKALPAAKSYYNICRLQNTNKAIDLMAEALAATKGKSTVRRFRMQQAMITDPPAGGIATRSPELGDNVLRPITVDSTPYTAASAGLDHHLRPFPKLMAEGNLLLLADQPTEARNRFEDALQHATNQSQRAGAIESIAKTIRESEGGVDAANVYIISARQTGDPIPKDPLLAQAAAGDVPLAGIQKWVTPIDTYGPPHESIAPAPPEVEPDGDVLPPEPLSYARACKPAEPELVGWLQKWESSLLANDDATVADMQALHNSLADSELSTTDAFEIARGMVYVYHVKDDPYEEVDPACIELTRAFVDRAERNLKGLSPSDPKGDDSVRMLTRLTWVWGSQDFPAAERIYRLLAGHDAADSKRSREATYLCAEAIYRQGRFDEAVAMYAELDKHNNLLGDVSDQDKSEIHWAIGMTLFYEGRDKDALPYLADAATNQDRSFADAALALQGSCYVKEKEWRKAVEVYDRLVARDTAKAYAPRLQEELCVALANVNSPK